MAIRTMEELLADIIRRLSALERRRSGAARDTGWTDLSAYVAPGFTVGTGVEIRAIGADVELRGNVATTAGWAAGTGVVDFLTAIPAAWRPTKFGAWGSAYNSGYPFAALVRASGTAAFTNRQAVTAGTTIQFTIRYFRG